MGGCERRRDCEIDQLGRLTGENDDEMRRDEREDESRSDEANKREER